MNFEKVVTEIKSVREFKKQGVDMNLVRMMIGELDQLKQIDASPLEFVLIEDGSSFAAQYDGKIGYFGKLVEAPSYILVFGANEDCARISAGYNLEAVRFSLHSAGIGSCWISPMDNVDYQALFQKQEGITLLGCLAIGEEYSGIFRKNTDQRSERKGVAEFVYKDQWKNECTWEDLELLGLDEVFYLTKLAPSWGNRQPWAFIVENNRLMLMILQSEETNYSVDAGIITYYFTKAAEAKGLSFKADVVKTEMKETKDDFACTVIFTM